MMKRHFVRSSLLLAGAAVLTLMTAGAASALSDYEAIEAVLGACPGPFRNQGSAQSCATHELNNLKATGQITQTQKGNLNSTVAQALQCQGGVCT